MNTNPSFFDVIAHRDFQIEAAKVRRIIPESQVVEGSCLIHFMSDEDVKYINALMVKLADTLA
jgi:hypothetical protein